MGREGDGEGRWVRGRKRWGGGENEYVGFSILTYLLLKAVMSV